MQIHVQNRVERHRTSVRVLPQRPSVQVRSAAHHREIPGCGVGSWVNAVAVSDFEVAKIACCFTDAISAALTFRFAVECDVPRAVVDCAIHFSDRDVYERRLNWDDVEATNVIGD